jgi:hypothetical protein
VSLGLLSVLLLERFRIILIVLLYLAILSIIAFEIFFNPQVYVFNPIIGYFPGTVYDEGIAVTGKLVFYRLFNILFFGIIIKISLNLIRNKKRKILRFTAYTSLVLLIVSSFYILSPKLGYSTTLNSLSSNLSKRIITDHFVIHCDRKIETDRIRMLALNHEYYYEELSKYFQSNLNEKIHSFIFYDNNQKKELFGSRNADVAKPWLNHIYLSIDNWEHTLKHELAHCFSAEFGSGIFKLASGLNPMLIEGIAEAADGNYNDNTLHYMAGLAHNSGYSIDLEYLLTKFGFYSQTSTISYIFAGSFIQYLIDEYGIIKFKEYYLTGEFQVSYKHDLSSTLKGYYNFLSNLEYEYSEDKAHYYFGRKSLFQKICPRAISEYLTAGWEQLNNYNLVGAEETFNLILTKTENYSALVGLIRSYEKENSIIKAVNILKKNIETFKST